MIILIDRFIKESLFCCGNQLASGADDVENIAAKLCNPEVSIQQTLRMALSALIEVNCEG